MQSLYLGKTYNMAIRYPSLSKISTEEINRELVNLYNGLKFNEDKFKDSTWPTFGGLKLTSLTPSRLTYTNALNWITSVSDLTAWVFGTSNKITSTSNGIGGTVISLPDVVYLGTAGKLGRDADNLIDFSTDNQITLRTNGVDQWYVDSNGDFQGNANDLTTTGSGSFGGTNTFVAGDAGASMASFLATGSAIIDSGDLWLTDTAHVYFGKNPGGITRWQVGGNIGFDISANTADAGDFTINIPSNDGTNKVSITDVDDVEVVSINSNGNLTSIATVQAEQLTSTDDATITDLLSAARGAFTGTTDAVQLKVTANATQTNDIFQILASDGTTEMLDFSNSTIGTGTGSFNIYAKSITNTIQSGINLQNTTITTSGSKTEHSPSLIFRSKYNSTTTTDNYMDWAITNFSQPLGDRGDLYFYNRNNTTTWTKHPFNLNPSNAEFKFGFALGEALYKGFNITTDNNATNLTDQYSPYTVIVGRGWKTAVTAASQAMCAAFLTAPEQGNISPIGVYKYIYGINATSPVEGNELVRYQWGSDAGVLGAIFNDQSLNGYTFRVEGDTDANLIFTDGTNDAVNIGSSTAGLGGKLNISGHTRLGIADTDKAYFGSGMDMTIWYDGTNGNIKTSDVAASDLNITCGANKTIELQNVVYNDANVGALVLITGGTLPGIVEWLNSVGGATGIYTRGFAVGEQVSGSIEIPHDYKNGTDLTFHVHWGVNDAPSGTDYVKWELTYSVTRDSVVFPAATVIVKETSVDTQYKCLRSDFTAITGTNFLIGDQFDFTLKRIASAGDAFSGEALTRTIGFHYQCDTIGSRQEFLK